MAENDKKGAASADAAAAAVADEKKAADEKAAAEKKAADEKAAADKADEEQRARMAEADRRTAEEARQRNEALAADRILITDFAGTANGPFAVYGENLDKGGQVRINGQVPEVSVIRPNVIKGVLRAPGLDLVAGPVVVELGEARFKGVL